MKESKVENKELSFERKWKTIKNFKKTVDNVYEVSNDGLVREKKTKKERHQKISTKISHPYYSVSLKQLNGKFEWVLVHQLVATFFVKKTKEAIEAKRCVIDHLDNNGLNNVYTNLRWRTIAENTQTSIERDDALDTGKCTFDKSDDTIHEICKLLETELSYEEMCEKLNQPYIINNVKFIRNVKKGLIRKDISDAYDFDRENVRYTFKQQVIAGRVKLIRQMIEMGKTNMEITKEIWPDLPKSTRKSRSRTVKAIREGRIYKDIK